jgi:hypothetical protein
MYLKLRILFTVLAALCLVVILPAGALFGKIWFLVFGGAAAVFFFAMLICKQKQEENTPLAKEEGEADFIETNAETDNE